MSIGSQIGRVSHLLSEVKEGGLLADYRSSTLPARTDRLRGAEAQRYLLNAPTMVQYKHVGEPLSSVCAVMSTTVA